MRLDRTAILWRKENAKTSRRSAAAFSFGIPSNRKDRSTIDRLYPVLIMAKSKNEPNKKRWSQKVTETSNALDLEKGVFALEDPHEIALSLKRSAELSRRRKSSSYRSAMSMLTFYINRAGKDLPKAQAKRLEAAKQELRELFGK
jgi:hypothetical protein